MKVLIVKLSAFGDIIHALPALDDVLARPEVSEVHWLVDSRFTFVTDVLPKQVKVHQIGLKGEHPLAEIRTTVKKLKAEKFDIALDFQGLIKSSVLARLICKRVYGFDESKIREKPASWLQTSVGMHEDEKTITQQCRKIAHAPWLQGDLSKIVMPYQAPTIHRTFSTELPAGLDNNKPQAVLVVGGSFETKMLPDATWTSFAQQLIAKGYQVVWCWGNKTEFNKATQLSDTDLGYALPKRLDMPELCNFLGQSAVVVAPDTGLLHLASAMGTPTISFWGPTPRWRNAPHAKSDLYVESNPECGPCIKKTCDNFICMDMIRTSEMVNRIDIIEGRELQ
ncbi:MAG: glycosyltransferase family 9 protein [Ghiorsea sp.]